MSTSTVVACTGPTQGALVALVGGGGGQLDQVDDVDLVDVLLLLVRLGFAGLFQQCSAESGGADWRRC